MLKKIGERIAKIYLRKEVEQLEKLREKAQDIANEAQNACNWALCEASDASNANKIVQANMIEIQKILREAREISN